MNHFSLRHSKTETGFSSPTTRAATQTPSHLTSWPTLRYTLSCVCHEPHSQIHKFSHDWSSITISGQKPRWHPLRQHCHRGYANRCLCLLLDIVQMWAAKSTWCESLLPSCRLYVEHMERVGSMFQNLRRRQQDPYQNPERTTLRGTRMLRIGIVLHNMQHQQLFRWINC